MKELHFFIPRTFMYRLHNQILCSYYYNPCLYPLHISLCNVHSWFDKSKIIYTILQYVLEGICILCLVCGICLSQIPKGDTAFSFPNILISFDHSSQVFIYTTMTGVDVDGTMLDVEAMGSRDNAIAARCCVAWGKFRKLLPVLTTTHTLT